MKKIKEISIQEIKKGRNWLIHMPLDFNIPMEEWKVEEKDDFQLTDRVAYSSIFAGKDGLVIPLILIREVGSLDYGGDYCEFRNGRWKQRGLESDPNAIVGKEFVANPLDDDPSFSSKETREKHREGFKDFVNRLIGI